MATTLIADDEADMLLLLRLVLRVSDFDIDIVGEASDGAEALARFIELGGPPIPDVVVLDNRMPRMSGIETAREILRERPGQRIILYSAHLNDDVRREAMEAGIRVCLHKEEIEQLPEVIRSLVPC